VTEDLVVGQGLDAALLRRLAAVQGVVFDVDGCLILSTSPAGHDGSALPGAVQAVEAIRAGGRRVVAFTNASARSPAEIAESLRRLGFDLAAEEVLTPSVVAASTVRQRFGDAPVLAFGGPGVLEVLADAGVRLVDGTDGAPVAAVVIGWDSDFDQPKVQVAAEALWAGAPMLVTSDATAFATAGRRSAGLAGFIAAGLAHVAGCGYEVLGKPSRLAVDTAAERLGVAPERILVAGDDLGLEAAMAYVAGGVGVLVTTGMHSRQDAQGAPPDRRPHLVVDRLTDLADALATADRTR
jgi:HAD superfamily hydrolase (TIGR01450 family)